MLNTLEVHGASATPVVRQALAEFGVSEIVDTSQGFCCSRPAEGGAWQFRTVIREGYESHSVNFAGHLVAISWGCGAPCQGWALVDVRNGIVYMVPFATAGGAALRPDGRLFVADPAQGTAGDCGDGPGLLEALCRGEDTTYYRWNGRALERIP